MTSIRLNGTVQHMELEGGFWAIRIVEIISLSTLKQ
jgi:hypothetical protein